MDDIKQLSWIPILGFTIGFISRKVFEVEYGYVNISDTALFDLAAVSYGVIFMILVSLAIIAVSNNEMQASSICKRRLRIANSSKRFKVLKKCYAIAWSYIAFLRKSFLLYIAFLGLIGYITQNVVLAVDLPPRLWPR